MDFYITPVDFDLCYEISDRIAKQLFRKEGKEYFPSQELGKTILNVGELGSYNLEIFPNDTKAADDAGQMITGCKIVEIWVDHLFSDKPDWSLIWRAELPLDSHSLSLVHKYFQKQCFITMVKPQQELFETKEQAPVILSDATVEVGKPMLCIVCNAQALYLGEDQSAWCGEHVHMAVGVQVLKIIYTTESVDA